MLLRRLTDGYIEYQFEPEEYHLVLRIPEFNRFYALDLKRVSISFLYDTLDTGGLHAKSSSTRGHELDTDTSDSQLVWPGILEPPEN